MGQGIICKEKKRLFQARLSSFGWGEWKVLIMQIPSSFEEKDGEGSVTD